jgi:hypothetical protein
VTARALAAALAAAAVCVGLAGCGSSGQGAAVRDFAAVEVGKTALEIAADGRSALVRLQTDPPTVCAIAYGQSAALGRIANDPGMGGTAIGRHAVLLKGLQPNTTYSFRLTATDAQGRVFQTRKLATFTTTPRKAQAVGRNVAQGAHVLSVSSAFGGGYGGANAVDGDLSTEWSSNGDGNRASITIDLGKATASGGVAFLTREMSDGSAIARTFAVVVDGGRRYGPLPAGTRLDPRIARVSFVGRRLEYRVVSSTGGNTGAAEIQAFGR